MRKPQNDVAEQSDIQQDIAAIRYELNQDASAWATDEHKAVLVLHDDSKLTSAEKRKMLRINLNGRVVDSFDSFATWLGVSMLAVGAIGFVGHLASGVSASTLFLLALVILGIVAVVVGWRTTYPGQSSKETEEVIEQIKAASRATLKPKFKFPMDRDERIARLAVEEAGLVRASKAYQSGELAKHDVQLDLDFEVNDIVTRAVKLCDERFKLVSAATARKTPVSPEAAEAAAAAERVERSLWKKVDAVEASLVRRVAALRRYRTRVVAIDEQLELVESLVHLHDGHDTLAQLLLGTADDEVSTSNIDAVSDELSAVRESLNAAVGALKDDTSELDLLLTR